ncbi:MAG TPA: MobF family relaxase [Ilumatobacter sp.]|nr:MobF family relaxase [Ilumatobacter sp.]
MRFTITPLGGAGRSVGQIVHAIVAYLQPNPTPTTPATATPPVGTIESPTARYYADSGEGPGRWSGNGAAAAGLVGVVDTQDFAQVLAGRDPATGRRLITAQGSAGRRPQLGVGTATMTGPGGEPWYDSHDAAAVLDLTVAELDALLDTGTQLAANATGTTNAPVPGSVPGSIPGLIPGSVPATSYLLPTFDHAGNRWVTEHELTRYETALATGITPAEVADAGAPDDLLPLGDAARLVGVIPRYLRRLAVRYERNRADIDAAVAAGQPVREAYLIGERGTRGRWFVTRAELAAFVGRRRPPAVRVGFDVTLTTEKSFGVLALLADDTTRAAVLDTIRDANDWALGWLEEHAAYTRIRNESVPVDGWTAASFEHLTSRALDPHVHHHNVVANTVVGPDGERRALDGRHLYDHAQAASALVTAHARYHLTETLGVAYRRGRRGGWEVEGIGDDVLHEFSQRRNEIDDALRELEEAIGRGATVDELQQVVLATRPAKQHTVLDTLRAEWWDRASGVGFTPDDLAACTPGTTVERELIDPAQVHAALAAPDGVCRNLSVFDRGDLLAAIVDMADPASDPDQPRPLHLTPDDVERLADSFLASGHVIDLGSCYTTREMLAVQTRIVAHHRAGLHTASHRVTASQLTAALASHPHLSDEQAALVSTFTTSGHRIQCAIGRAGAGKTTAMAAAVDAWTAAGYRVLGAAVKGEAARTLAAATGIRCETLAWYLAHPDPDDHPLDANTVLIVDEASTISDRDLDRLVTLAEQTGTTLRLIGDPAQHSAVEAGGMFRVLCQRFRAHTPELTTSHRLKNPHDRAAADHLRAGEIDRALTELAAAGHLHVIDNELDFYRDILNRWWTNHQHGIHHPMIDRRNRTRRNLNRLAHTLLRTAGEIGGDEITASDDRRFTTGDRVVARIPNRDAHPHNQPDRYIRNGSLGTITGIRPHATDAHLDRLIIDFDDLGTIAVDRSYFDEHDLPNGRRETGIDHAYAATSYAVQGSTYLESAGRIDPTANRSEAYVDITRGQHANHLYLTRPTDPLDGETLPALPPPPTRDEVAARLINSRGERTAYELHEARQQKRDDLGHAVGL